VLVRYFIGMSSIALVAFIIYGAILFGVYRNTSQAELSRLSEMVLAQTVSIYEIIITGIEQRMLVLAEDEGIINFINMPAWYIENDLTHSHRGELIDRLFFPSIESPFIHSIYLYSYNNNYILTCTDLRSREDFFDTSWLYSYEENGHSQLKARVLPYTLPIGEYNSLTYMHKITIENEVIGIMAININSANFARAINQGFDDLGENPDNVVIIDNNSNVIFSNQTAVINYPLAENMYHYNIVSAVHRDESAISFTRGRITMAAPVPSLNHVILSSIQGERFGSYIRNILSVLITGSIVGVVVSLLLALIVSVVMYNQILEMISVFPYTSPISDNATGELQYISGNIVNMMKQSQLMEQELASRLTELKKAQSIALQTQINPHFLLNTLQYVSMDIMRETRKDTAGTKIVSLLSDIVRNNFNTAEYLVTIAHEIGQAQKYMQLLNIKKDADGLAPYNVAWDISDDAMQQITLRFIIQPILENCVTHGYGTDWKEDKNIEIKAFCKDKKTYIRVRDNGKGMTEESLSALKSQLSKSQIKEQHHIGLSNVNLRIKLVFGEDYGLFVESNNGFVVTAVMPQL